MNYLKLKLERVKKGISLKDLADMTDLTPNTCANVENGKGSPLFSTVMRIAKALEVPMEALDDAGDAE